MIIYCDIDDTITNMNHIWVKRINAEYETKYQYKDVTYWGFFGDLQKQGIDVLKYLEMDNFYDEITVYSNAVDVLEHIVSLGHKVYLVTATDVYNPALQHKMNCVLNHFNPDIINKNNVVITQDKSIVNGDILIDDKLETCLEWRSRGKSIYLPSQPWNQLSNRFSNCKQQPFSENEENDTMNERWLQLGEKLNLKFNK